MLRSRLLLAVGLALALAVAACDTAEEPAAVDPEPGDVDTPGPAETPDEPVEPEQPEQPDGYGEAPELAAMVEAGDLPPVEERLPDSPLVVEPHERVGVYGGDWTTGATGPGDMSWLYRTTSYDQLTRWNADRQVVPNVAEDVEVNDDATEYTIHLREGMRWSDGEPFTAADIMFWYEDVVLNDQLTESTPSWLMAGGELGVVEMVDDHTVTFTFAAPHGTLLQRLATPSGAPVTGLPRHHLERFHADHNPDVDQLVAESGQEDWIDLFALEAGVGEFHMHPGLPSLTAWVMTVEFADGPQVIFERNPYYWKVDTAGNQLPYLDRVVFDVVDDAEVLLLRAMNGELTFHSRHFTTMTNKSVLADHRDAGGYDFVDITPATMNGGSIPLNLTHKDPVLREIFNNKDFRIGLSHAIDRQEIIDVVFVGQGEPHQLAPRPESEFYNERLAKQYTEYDVDLANEHLDRAGYAERDPQGYRLGPDGQRISFTVDVPVADYATAWLDVLELVERYWAEVGVEVHPSTMDTSLFSLRTADNDHDAIMWGGDGGLDVIIDPRWYFPFSGSSTFARAWADWYESGGEEGEEPPEGPRRQMELYDQLLATADPAEQHELMEQILEIAADEFYVIATTLSADEYAVVTDNFHNVPQRFAGGWQYVSPALANPEQFFLED